MGGQGLMAKKDRRPNLVKMGYLVVRAKAFQAKAANQLVDNEKGHRGHGRHENARVRQGQTSRPNLRSGAEDIDEKHRVAGDNQCDEDIRNDVQTLVAQGLIPCENSRFLSGYEWLNGLNG